MTNRYYNYILKIEYAPGQFRYNTYKNVKDDKKLFEFVTTTLGRIDFVNQYDCKTKEKTKAAPYNQWL